MLLAILNLSAWRAPLLSRAAKALVCAPRAPPRCKPAAARPQYGDHTVCGVEEFNRAASGGSPLLLVHRWRASLARSGGCRPGHSHILSCQLFFVNASNVTAQQKSTTNGIQQQCTLATQKGCRLAS